MARMGAEMVLFVYYSIQIFTMIMVTAAIIITIVSGSILPSTV